MAKKTILIAIEESTLDEIEMHRHKYRLRSRNQAINNMLDLAMAQGKACPSSDRRYKILEFAIPNNLLQQVDEFQAGKKLQRRDDALNQLIGLGLSTDPGTSDEPL